jgi:endonuclease/exonuclease/phosphatase family metal-dependent hydrolase
MTDRVKPASLTLASFNIHMGIDGWGRRFDVVEQCAGLDADVLVLQESWNPDGDDLSTAAAVAAGLGYELVAEVGLARGRLFDPIPTTTISWAPRLGLVRKSFRLDDERWAVNAGPADRRFVAGQWGIALLSRIPAHNCSVVPLGKLRRDPARRAVISCDIDLDGGRLSVHGTHMSHITHGSHTQYRLLSRQLPPPTTAAVLAGDMNMWGPPVSSYFRGWRRTLRARTWPAQRPHSQLDHVLATGPVQVVDARVGAFAGSDHLPVMVTLTLA